MRAVYPDQLDYAGKTVVAKRNCRKTTPVGFEPTRAKPNGLAGRRLNHSAKVSMLYQKWFLRSKLVPALKAASKNFTIKTYSVLTHSSALCVLKHCYNLLIFTTTPGTKRSGRHRRTSGIYHDYGYCDTDQMVELSRIELLTSCVPGRRCPS